MPNWRTRIQISPKVLSGKPVIKGGRLTVEFILSLMANGWTESQLFATYPQLSRKDLEAIFAYCAEKLHDDHSTINSLKSGDTPAGDHSLFKNPAWRG